MMRVTLIEVDHLGTPVRWLGACLMPHAPREKELVRMPHAREEPFVVVRVTYHISPSEMVLQNRDGQSVPELTYGTCEVHLR
jgi:hypothetical protein